MDTAYARTRSSVGRKEKLIENFEPEAVGFTTKAVRQMSKVAGKISKTALLPSSDNKHFTCYLYVFAERQQLTCRALWCKREALGPLHTRPSFSEKQVNLWTRKFLNFLNSGTLYTQEGQKRTPSKEHTSNWLIQQSSSEHKGAFSRRSFRGRGRR